MKMNIMKKGVSALLAVVMCLSAFLGIGSTTAFAAENTTAEVVMMSFPREGDDNYSGDWGHDELHYMNGWSASASSKITVYTIGSWSGNACYCIEPGTPLAIGDVMTKRDETYWDNYPSAYNKTISADEIKLFIGRIFQYGYTGTVDIGWRSQNAADADKLAHIMATQTLVWETVVGERDSNFNHVDTGSYDAVSDRVSKNHPLYSQYISYYNSIVSNVQKHSKVPSFFAKSTSKAQDIELEWNGTNYSATLTDTNNVLSNYSFAASESGIEFSVSGSKLTITATKAPANKVSITATKNGSVRKGVVVWSDGEIKPGSGIQDLSTFAAEVNDPVRGYLNIKVSLGSAKIVKTSEDGNVSGISFTITGNGVNKTVKTGSNGEIVIDNLSPGTYTVTEQNISYYEPQQSKTVTVVSGQTASVAFNNVLKRSDLKVIKTSEDNMNEGVKFHLYGKSATGQNVDLYATTDKNGVAMFKDVLIGTNYTLEEVETAERYIVPDSQDAVIEWEKVTENDFYNELKRGDLKVVKTSEDNMVEGIKFHLYGTSLSGHQVDEYAVTDKNGIAMFEDILIGSRYTLEEVNTAEKYIVPDAQTVEIEWNKVTNKSFENILKRGDLKVIKSAEDKLVEGLKFHLYGTSLSGIKVDEYATTDKNGVATFENILIGSNYTVEEVDTPVRYVIPESQSAVIEWNKVTEKSFENILKKWRADVFKLDSELADNNGGSSGVPVKVLSIDSDEMVEDLGDAYGKTQGDATLGGAVYGVYKGETLVDTYTTDENGYFITDYYVCGDDWSIREIKPSEGYLLDATIYHIDCSAENYTVELNTEYPDVYEDIIKGKIAIIKHCDDGSTKIETPEEGATFAVYLKSAGSYDNAKETERAVLVCDEFGFAETSWLPYGIYVVEQIDGWDGKEMMPAFEVNVNADGETYRYLINNATFEAEIEIVKKDAETGKIIPASGIGFKVRNTDTGEYVIQRVNYPTPVDIEIYYTDSAGKLMLPAPLPYGNYEIIEQNTCYGYVLDSDPVAFKVDGTTDLVTVVKSNVAQKGTISVEKTGEVFSSVRENEGVYQPVYEVQGLAGVVYEITAAEDVVTLDGTVRYTKGQVVATITTDSTGTATTEPLYLGKYVVTEITAPHGMILNAEPATVELSYAGENVKVTTTSASFYNERQKVEIDLIKSLEKDDIFGIGNADEITRVKFAMFAAEEMTAADGKVIPKDAPIEIATCDANGKITFATDIPVGAKVYVKEYATDSHYILSDSIYEVSFDYEGQTTDTVRKNINDGNAIENEMIRGSIVGKKLDEDGFTICGALFGLFAENETEFTEDTAILTCESNEIGIFHFEDVPFGRWIVREIKSAPAFVLNENSYAVTVSEHEQVVEITIENEFITGSVKTIKVDKEYPENTLSGAIFEIYVDVNGNQEFDSEIDVLVGEMTEGENGEYFMENLRYNGYFLHEKNAPEGFLQDENHYYFEIRNDGETVIVENEAGVGFVNQPIKGNVTTTKVDEEYPENKLSGAVFHIYADTDKNGEYNAEVDTFVVAMTETDIGIYFAEGLRYGGYFLFEETAPEGFVKDDNYHYFEIRNDGETITVENKAGIGFTNKPIVGDLELTKTDIADGKPLAGVGFRIKDENGNTVIEGYTDENGVAKFTLRYGKYTYSEFDPLEGYIANTDEYPFEITEEGQIIKATVTNEKIPVPDIPQTGDESNLGFWIGLGGIALGGLVAMVIIAIKRKKDDEE